MEKKHLIKRILAGILYAIGILFALFICTLAFYDNLTFNLKGIIIAPIGVFIPSGLATYILISFTNEYSQRLKIMRVFVLITFAFYNILLISLLFCSRLRYINTSTVNIPLYIKFNANIIPFKTIVKYISSYFNHSMGKFIILQNLLGNLLVFAPMGILLPCIYQKLHKFDNFIVTLMIILFSVEIIQLLTFSGTFDIDDVILNSIGAVLFYCLWKTKMVKQLLTKIYILKDNNRQQQHM